MLCCFSAIEIAWSTLLSYFSHNFEEHIIQFQTNTAMMLNELKESELMANLFNSLKLACLASQNSLYCWVSMFRDISSALCCHTYIYHTLNQSLSLSLSHTHTHTHTHTRARTHTCTHTNNPTHTYSYTYAQTDRQTNTHTHTHTHTHTYTFTHAHLFLCCAHSLGTTVCCTNQPYFFHDCNITMLNWLDGNLSHASLWWQALPFSNSPSSTDRLVGLVVKASCSRVEDPRFKSHLHRDFSWVESYQWLKYWHSSGYPARRLALWGLTGTGQPSVSILWLGEVESLVCNFYLSVAAHKIVWADPSLRCTSMLLCC